MNNKLFIGLILLGIIIVSFIFLIKDDSVITDSLNIFDKEGITKFLNWSDSVSAYYSLNETLSSQANDTLGRYNGTYYGDMPTNATGKIGYGQYFDGVGDYMQTGLQIANNLTYSISLWFNSNVSGFGYIYSEGRSSSNTPYMFIETRNTGAVNWEIQSDASALATIKPATNYSDNNWHHLVLVRNGTNSHKLYIDNVLLGTNTTSIGTLTLDTTTVGRLKRVAFDASNYTGIIDELGIWNKSLNSTEISDLYNGGVGLDYGQGGSDVTSPQYSTNSTNSTVVGTLSKHSLYWMDTSLSGYIFSFNNGSGTFVNDSWVSMTGTANWSNVSKIINYTIGTTIQWKVWANDSSGNNNLSQTYSYITTGDSIPPVFNISYNLSSTEVPIDISSWITVDPNLIQVEGVLYVVYGDETPTPGWIYLKNSTDNGATWSSAYNLSQASSGISANAFINHLSNGKWILTYMNQTAGMGQRNVLIRQADTWQDLATATTTTMFSYCNGNSFQCEGNTNVLELPNGELLYTLRINDTASGAYTNNYDKIQLINASISTPTTWTNKSWISTTVYQNTAHWYITNTSGSTGLLIGFYNNTPEGSEHLRFMNSSDGGLTWGNVYNYSTTSDPGRPALGTLSGGLTALFHSERDTFTHYFSVSQNNGTEGSWEPIITIKDYPSNIGYGSWQEILPGYIFLAYSTNPKSGSDYDINGTWINIDQRYFSVGLGQSLYLKINGSDETSLSGYSINWSSPLSIDFSTGVITNISSLSEITYAINVTINDSSNNKKSKIFYVTYGSGGGGGGGDFEVTLNSPSDDEIIYTNQVTFNSTGNVTTGNYLTNASLYTNESGSWIQENTTNISTSSYSTSTHGYVDHIGTTTDPTFKYGMKVTATQDLEVVSITKFATDGSTYGYITDSSLNLLVGCTFSGTVCTFTTPYPLTSGVTYYFVGNMTSGTHRDDETSVSYPVVSNGLSWIAGRDNAGDKSDEAWTIKEANVSLGITTNYSTKTFLHTYSAGETVLWNVLYCDNSSACTFADSNYTFYTSSDIPIITILSGNGTTYYSGSTHTINFTVNTTNILDACWLQYNGSNTTVTGCAEGINNSITFSLDTGINEARIWANDTLGNLGSEYLNWSITMSEGSPTYNAFVYETDYESFSVNFSYNLSSTPTISPKLVYNGTYYAGTSTCYSGYCTLSKSIDIPLVTNQLVDSENKTFFWEVTIFNANGTTTLNTSEYQQNVSNINFSRCSSGTFAVNFSIYNETTKALVNVDFSGTSESYLGTGTVKDESNYSNSGTSYYPFCINYNETFYTDSYIRITSGLLQRIYQFREEPYTNSITEKKLYLPNDDTSSIIIEVKDQGLIPLPNYLTKIYRFYEDLNEYRLIESRITDEFGQFAAKLIQNSVKYKFEFYDESNNLVKTSSQISVICRTSICFLPFVIETQSDYFGRYDNLSLYSSSLTFDNTTNTFTYSWDDQRGESATTRLEVIRYNLNSSSVVCNSTSTSSVSALSCAIGSTDSTYKAQSFRVVSGNDEKRISSLFVEIGDQYSTYGIEGLLWVFILLFTCIGIGAFNPSVGAVLYGAGFIFFGLIGFISMPLPVFFANTLIVAIFVWAVRT